jgi:peroxiredoxin
MTSMALVLLPLLFAFASSVGVAQAVVQVDAGWIFAQEEDQGWKVLSTTPLITPSKENEQEVPPPTRRCNLRTGDLILSVDALDLSQLGPLAVAALLGDLPFRTARIEVLRDGGRWALKPFADKVAGTEKATTFTAEQLQKRDAPPPQFSLPDLEGRLHSLSSLRGRWVLLNFWGTWCSGCIDELPALEELGRHYTSKLNVIGIDLNDKRETLQQFVRNEQLPYVVLVGGTFDDQTARAYNVDRAPTNVVIDPEGRVRFVGLSLKAAVQAVSTGLQQR